MTSVLLTGASGFIGRRCIPELLALGYEVYAVSRRPTSAHAAGVRWLQGDLLVDDDIVRIAKTVRAENLLHLAWIATPPQFWTSELNVDWLRASLRLVKCFVDEGGARIVVNGSCAEYAPPANGPCVEDVTAIQPATLYGKSKAALHLALQGYAEQRDVSYAWARPFFVYGPNEPPSKFVSVLLNNCRAGKTTTFREPNKLLDYVYVADVARALATLVASNFEGAVNIATGLPVTPLEMQTIVSRLLTREEPELSTPEETPHSGYGLYADVTRLHRELGFSPHYTFRDGVSQMIAEYASDPFHV